MSVRTSAGVSALDRLASGTAWTLAASVTAALSQWLLLVVTAKLGSVEMVGQLAMSFAIVAPIQTLTDLALRPALATDAGGEFHFRDYARLRGMMITIFLTVVTVAATLRGGATAPIILVIGLQKAIESASDLLFGLFQREDRVLWMGQSVVLRSCLSSLAFLTTMLVSGNLLVACLAGWVVRIGVFALHDYGRVWSLLNFADQGKPQLEHSTANRTGELLLASVPLAIAAFLMSFTVNIPRYAVERQLGGAMLGVFAALLYFFQAGAMLIDAVGQAAWFQLARYHVQGNQRAFHCLQLKLTAMATATAGVGILVAWIGGGPLLAFAYSAAFAVKSKTFLWMSLCTLPWYWSSVLGYALVARRQMVALFICQAVSFAITLAGSYWLIGNHGLSGACAVVFLTYSTQLFLYLIVLRHGSRGTATSGI